MTLWMVVFSRIRRDFPAVMRVENSTDVSRVVNVTERAEEATLLLERQRLVLRSSTELVTELRAVSQRVCISEVESVFGFVVRRTSTVEARGESTITGLFWV
ncbi:hypothetical protein [Halorussus caseinilyticus]|uniref:hypothetical protein n=1 Tax=Halorussus caseinilyticus TaxID=3034025 RepID=UPI0023E82AB0|nr:hypothetical protein [Halorussus sp. DT72]